MTFEKHALRTLEIVSTLSALDALDVTPDAKEGRKNDWQNKRLCLQQIKKWPIQVSNL
jgi:hypothetical protein